MVASPMPSPEDPLTANSVTSDNQFPPLALKANAGADLRSGGCPWSFTRYFGVPFLTVGFRQGGRYASPGGHLRYRYLLTLNLSLCIVPSGVSKGEGLLPSDMYWTRCSPRTPPPVLCASPQSTMICPEPGVPPGHHRPSYVRHLSRQWYVLNQVFPQDTTARLMCVTSVDNDMSWTRCSPRTPPPVTLMCVTSVENDMSWTC